MKTQRNILIIAILISLFANLVYGLEGERQIAELQHRDLRQAAVIQDQDTQIEVLEVILDHQEELEPAKQYIGEFEITYYTAGHESTGKNPGNPAYGITRSGTTVKEGQTIAADWSVLEPGTKVFIEGVGERVVEDTGGAIVGQAIDVYVEDVQVALNNGRHTAKVYVIEED